jgi:hypothetical protein
MQLRVARLCLDCEELHTDHSCPVCASDRYAYLSTWLPVEERRRWARRPTIDRRRADGGFASVVETVSEWFRGPSPEASGPLTRKSDHVAPLNFDDVEGPDAKGHPVERGLKKRDA